uniref:Ycf2 protein n=1 Tax=Encalypta ciliata TaxID=130446 RepID=UPI00286B51BC|nr:Ycf2 protein [Encalypta ciliata]UVG41313.1 Ycf2 protein [Encalypta ciliata]
MKQELSKNKYLYKRLKLEEIKNSQYFFELWTESNLVKFLIRLFFNKESFIKLFDFRIISSLILRDLYSLKTNKNLILNTFLLPILSIFLYHLNTKAIIEKKNLNLIKIVYGHINYYKYKEKRLEGFNNKNVYTFTNYSFSKIFALERRKKKYSIIEKNLKKKNYIIPTYVYDQNLFEDSEWWKLWIIEQILPSWKISSSSVKKIDSLLEKKNTDDLKHFFEFYIDNIFCQNYDWEDKFNSIFYKDFGNKTKLASSENEKILEETLILQIFSAFCEKLIFEIESLSKSNTLNSIIKLNNTNNKFFFSIPISYKKKVNPELFYLLKKKIIQNLIFWGETDPIIAKSYFFMKRNEWRFFNNYVDFYVWQLNKNFLFQYENYLQKLNINKNKLSLKLFTLNSLDNKNKFLRIDQNLSEISYQMSKYILYKIENNTKLTYNYKITNQNLKLKNEEKIEIKTNLNLAEINFFNSNKFFFKQFIKSDNRRFIFSWKIKKNYNKLNSFISSDYVYKIIHKKKYNLNKLKFLIRSNFNKNIKYKKNLLFQIKHFVKLIIFLDKLNLLIIKSNLFYNKPANYNINYKIYENYNLKKKLLVNLIIYRKSRKENKILTKNDLKKRIQFYNFFTKSYIKISLNFYKSYFKLIYKNLTKFLNNLFLINKFFYSGKKTNIKNITKNIIDQNLINWKKEEKIYFYYSTVKKNIYIYCKFNQYILADRKKKKIFKFFIKKQKNLLFLSNQINFLNNKNSIIKWSDKLKKKNSYIFYKTFIFIFYENINKISKLLIYYPKILHIKFFFSKKKILNKNNLLEKLKFNIYYKLKTYLYFDKILIMKFFINYFNNNKICTKSFNNLFFYPIWQNQEIYFSFVRTSNKNLLNFQFFKADTLKLLNFLYYSDLSYKKKLNFYGEKKKNNNLTYTQLIKSISVERKKEILSAHQLTFFAKKIDKKSNGESKIYKNFLFQDIKNFKHQKLTFVHHFNLNKLLNSLFEFNPTFYRKDNLKKNTYIQKQLESNKNFYQTDSFEHYLLSEFFSKIQNENNQIINWIDKLFIINFNSKKNLINILLNKNGNNRKLNYEKNKKIFLSFSKNYIKLIPQTRIHKIFKTSNFFVKWTFLEKYRPWFFTSKWWKYFQNIVLNLFSEILINIKDQFNYILPTTLENRKKILNYLLKILSFNLKNKIIGNSFEIWNLRLLEQINEQNKNQENEWPWFSLKLINKWNKQYIATISLIIFGYFLFQKYLSILLGSDYLELWGSFEIIRYLIDSSRGIHFDNLINNNSIQFSKSENLLIHFFKNLKHYIKNAKFYLFTKKKIHKLLISNKGLDLSRRERKLLVQSLITNKSIDRYRSDFISNSNSINFEFGNPIIKQQKFKNYLEILTENYQKSLVNYPFHQFHLADNLVYLSSWQKPTFLHKLWQSDTSKSNFYKKPVPLELRLFSSKGILLIGSLETGRSYLVKNIAANSFIPLIKISINKLLYNKPDIITESWMNILMESLRRLKLILELAEKLSPCIIWIQNIHELNVNRSTQNVESDPTFLLGIFLKYFQTDFSKKNINTTVIIGSTHLPKKVDPALISPNRLDQLINIRLFNILQREKKISILLHSKHSKYFYSKKKKSCLNEFGHRTMGYTARDLAGLINEILLISIAQNQSIIEKKTIRLAFHRQALGFTYIKNKINLTQTYGILFYKVGKVIVQNLFFKNPSKNPLYFGNDLWKKKFYYLSKWYLEPSLFESTIKEFTILPHILSCLAGVAARDSWFILENKPENIISLDKSAENDFYLACGILESLLIDFSWLEVLEVKNTNKKKILNFRFQTKNPLYMIKKGLYQLTSNITWAPKISRLNFIRTNLFNWINRPNEFKMTYNFAFSKRKDKKKFNDSTENSYFFEVIQNRIKEQLPYERILSRIRRRNVQELEFQLEDLLLEEQFVILGFSRLFTEYRMESQLSNKPMLFIEGRFLWDPTGLLSQNHHVIFSRQDLFIDGEILRRLYVTYGARREREKSHSSQKIKQFFLRRGYGRDSINDFSINWWNQLPFIEKNNVETFKRIEGIGVQLKRPQVFTPVYSYQRWLIENPQKNLTRFELLNNQKRWLKANSLLFNDSFIYNILLEMYQHLLNFFISHQVLLNEMTKLLLKNKWLFQNEIEYFINKINKIN